MTAFASILTPMTFSNAIQLSNRLWRKKVLPVGDIEYQGRQLHFTRPYLEGLASAFRDRAYDAVSFQLAPGDNSHTNDPERHRGLVTDMTVESDGLYVTVSPTERGERVLTENPYLGVSARIVEQYARSDGKFYPAAVQHVLGTLDPRIPGLGAWQPVDMANSGAITIDLSGYSFAGEPAPAATAADELSDAELGDLLDAMDEAGLLDGGGTEDPVYDPGYAAAAEQFDAAYSARVVADAAREQARFEFDQLDLLRPAIRSEDRMARIMAKAGAGLYDGQQQDFTAEAAGVEILLANGGHGPCGPLDDFGRCASRYHELGCSHDQATDWLAQEGGPPRSTYQASFANFAAGLNIDLAPRAVFDDPDDADLPPQYMPARTVELAHQLAHDWGLDASAPGFPGETTGFTDLLRPPGAPVSIQDELLADMGYELPAQERPAYPGISKLRARMGI